MGLVMGEHDVRRERRVEALEHRDDDRVLGVLVRLDELEGLLDAIAEQIDLVVRPDLRPRRGGGHVEEERTDAFVEGREQVDPRHVTSPAAWPPWSSPPAARDPGRGC